MIQAFLFIMLNIIELAIFIAGLIYISLVIFKGVKIVSRRRESNNFNEEDTKREAFITNAHMKNPKKYTHLYALEKYFK